MDKRTSYSVLKAMLLMLTFCCLTVFTKECVIDTTSSLKSDAEAKVAVEQYSDYGYTQAELDLITEDIKCGRDVSSYIKKGQSSEEFAAARDVMRADENKAFLRHIALAIVTIMLAIMCLFVDVRLNALSLE